MMKEDWVRKKIKDICDKASSNIVQNKVMDNNGDYPLYGASGFVKCLDFYHRDEPYIGIVKDGSGVGRVNVYPAYSSLVGTMQYVIPKNGFLLGYIKYVLQSLNLAHFASGAAIPHIYFKDYGECTVLIPPLSEQESIVAELDKLNEILAKKHEQLKELDRLGQAIFYDMFGDPIHNDRKWKSCTLSQISDVGSSRRVFVEDLVENGIPFYRGTEIGTLSLGEKINPKLYITEEHYNRLKELTGVPVYGDLLLPSICHDGKIWKVNTHEPFYFKDGRVLWIHLNSKDVDGEYLQYMLREKIIKDYVNIASGTTFSELKIFALKKVLVILPPIDLQLKFAEQMKAIESQKQKIKQSLVEVQQLLDYTMNKYFG